MNSQHAGGSGLIPMGLFEDTANVFAFELMHGFAEVIALLVELLGEGGMH